MSDPHKVARACTVGDCAEQHVARGYCARHYQQARRDGMQTLPPPAHHRLSNVDEASMTADCSACGARVPLRKLGAHDRLVCEVKLLDSRRRQRERELSENRAKYNAYHRDYLRRRKYGLPGGPEAVEVVLSAFDASCGICRCELTVDSMRIDHDHDCCDLSQPGSRACGECVRGILCNSCNTGLGLLGDRIEGARAAVAYLSRWQDRP